MGVGLLVTALWSPWAFAHHSFAKFDRGRVVEIEGEITEVFWRNPHVLFTLRGRLEGQREQVWHLETNSPGILRRVGITDGMVNVGDSVLVAGNPTVNGAPEINALNLLLPDNRELVLGRGQTHFDGRQVGDFSAWTVREGDKSRPELGLFRVWSTSFGPGGGLFNRAPASYPLTDAALEAVENFDEVAGSERLANDCTPKGMPWIMEQPYDVMFERDGDDILFKLEEFDVVRQIHMDFAGDRAAQPYSVHGFSTGTWEGSTLVVETTNLNSENFQFEIPATDRATLVERFTPSAEGDRLDYTIVVTDPGTFTEPVTLSHSWLSLPDQVFDSYNCGQSL